MKNEVHPGVIAVAIVFLVAVAGFFLYKATKPAYYIPSPGAGGRPARGAPAYAKAPGDASSAGASGAEPVSSVARPMNSMQQQYLGSAGSPVVPPANSTPGDPHSLKR